MANQKLHDAKQAKNDEFYTQWFDIEQEMNAYLEYDPDAFRDKTILLPCDDPEWSNFTKFFALHFSEYGIKKLISTSYAPASNAGGAFYAPTAVETGDPGYDEEKSRTRGRVFTLVREDVSGDGRIDIDDIRWEYLEGDGDFRSDEITALRDEADMVITNPPFSLFREVVSWLVDGRNQFTIIGSKNAITYKEIFPLIQNNEMWVGARPFAGGMWFRVPDGSAFDRMESDGTMLRNVPACWFTNIDHGQRHKPLKLMTSADNFQFSRHKQVQGIGYARYTNYDAIEVPFVDAIPSDHSGAMGVPITFLDKYNPDQFEIIGNSKWVGLPISDFAEKGTYPQGGMRFYLPNGDGTHRRLYDRIVIRHRDPDGEDQ